ncbi:MAG: hypothetical protein ABIQ62_04195 [Thermomonas sp.]
MAAFLRGTQQRARLLAIVQAGALVPAQQALMVVARVFAADAERWPIAQWPQQYWRLLLAAPHLREVATVTPDLPLPGIARLPPLQRSAMLLQLVAGLDDAAAAAVLGMQVADYQDAIRDGLPRDPLDRPDIDVWRAWRAAAQRELAVMESPLIETMATAGDAAPTKPELVSADLERATKKAPGRLVRWLWLGVAACVLAFATTFFLHPAGRAVLQRWTASIKVEALPTAAAPKARFDAGDVSLHPDRDLLAAPEEAAHASELALLSWLAVNIQDPRAADAVRLPVIVSPLLRTPLDPARDAARLASRMRQWDTLPPRVRGLRRGQWQAWRALEARERILLRDVAPRWRALDPQQQQVLHARFDAQSSDARNGWWLGPQLGLEWPRVQALFAYSDAGQRDALLAMLRDADSSEWDALARLAQATPPEARAQLRTELLAQAPSQRGAWLQARLER